ncbi:MAG: family 78 glycoside hydrolase catalytic domain [Phycisphaerales bacterium]|nr:family 78 glycoside hydrolase catalytic domain [Phycisphaerales bacterium]
MSAKPYFMFAWAAIFIFNGLATAATIAPTHLRCQYWRNPRGVDLPQPRLSWQVQAKNPQSRNLKQSAYDVLVASSLQKLALNQGDLWNSGRVASSQTDGIPYAGKSLVSAERCFWKLRLWDQTGQPSAWSKPSRWQMGLLHQSDWQAHWIMAPANKSQALPIFRRDFHLPAAIARVELYICGLGQYAAYINGKAVGQSVLNPGWTKYSKTCLYRVYNVTALVHGGANAIGVLLGNGMYNVEQKRYAKFHGTFGPPKLIAQLRIVASNGTVKVIGTDTSWQTIAGPITFSSTYGGEDFNAMRNPIGWTRPGFTGSGWTAAVITHGPGGTLACVRRSAPPIKIHRVLVARSFYELPGGKWVYDLGQNCANLPEITVRGAAGESIKMSPGEWQNANRTIGAPIDAPVYFKYTIAPGGEAQTWHPLFTYFGSRYIMVTGAVPAGRPNPQHRPVIERVAALFVHGGGPQAGAFQCSSTLFNNTAKIIRWAMRSNMMSILTDCPTREKLGWLEQDHLMGPSLMYSYGMRRLFGKITGDIADSQTADGLVPDIAPEYVVFSDGFRNSVEWGSAAIAIPWQLYSWYGDKYILIRRYNCMRRYLAFLQRQAKANILYFGLGDWYDLGPKFPGFAQLTPIPFTATAYYYRDAMQLAKIAHLLGRQKDAIAFGQLAGRIRQSFNAKWYHAGVHSYATGSQTSNAIPLVFGLAPKADRAGILKSLVANIRKHNFGLTAGDVGYRFVLQALARGGRSDVVFTMNNQTTKPGYGFILAQGATALTESWKAIKGPSWDHFMLGHIMEWFYRDLAGIQPDPNVPAFRHIIIRPTVVGDITWARATCNSAAGPITSSWRRAGDIFNLHVVVPPNTTATVYLPAKAGPVTESNKPVPAQAGTDGMMLKQRTATLAIIHIGSGDYHFRSQLP